VPTVKTITIRASGTRSIGYQTAGFEMEVGVEIAEGDDLATVVKGYRDYVRGAVDKHLDGEIPALTDRAVEYKRVKDELRF
jgi:hypothetical protein